MDTLPLHATLLLRLSVRVGEIVPLGAMPTGERRMVAIDGGEFAGAGPLAHWRGVVMAGGVDWQLQRADGVLEVEARYGLQGVDGARVQVVSQGMRHGPPEVLAALARGEVVDPALVYFRTAMRFEADAAHLLALNRLLAVGVGRREARAVHLSVYAVG